MRALRASIPCWLEDAENGLTDRFRRLLQGLWEDLQHLHSRFGALDRQLHELADTDPVAQRLQQLRGVGPLVATAMVATIGDGAHYHKGKQMLP